MTAGAVRFHEIITTKDVLYNTQHRRAATTSYGTNAMTTVQKLARYGLMQKIAELRQISMNAHLSQNFPYG